MNNYVFCFVICLLFNKQSVVTNYSDRPGKQIENYFGNWKSGDLNMWCDLLMFMFVSYFPLWIKMLLQTLSIFQQKFLLNIPAFLVPNRMKSMNMFCSTNKITLYTAIVEFRIKRSSPQQWKNKKNNIDRLKMV